MPWYLKGGAMQDGTGCLCESEALGVSAAGELWGVIHRGAPFVARHLELASEGGDTGLYVSSRCQEVILLFPGKGATQTLYLSDGRHIKVKPSLT